MNPWKRVGLGYEVTTVFANGRGTLTRRLGIISYHLILWIHGERKLIEMAGNR